MIVYKFHSHLCDRADLDTSFVNFEKRPPQPEIKSMRRIHRIHKWRMRGKKLALGIKTRRFRIKTISYPESSGFLVSGATPGRLWGHQILSPQDFCGKTMETVTEQPIKKIEFFRCPQSLPGVAPLTKKPEDSGYEIGIKTNLPASTSSQRDLLFKNSKFFRSLVLFQTRDV